MLKLIHPKIVTGFILAFLLNWGGQLTAQTTPVGFSLSGASVTEKDTFSIVISADTLLTGRDVFAYRFYLSYNPSYYEFLGMEGTGPVLSGWGDPVLNSSNPGTLILAGAGTQPLSGSGEMIYLRFIALRPSNSYISFNISGSYLNEGNPSSIYENANIYAAARSYPNIYPDEQQMFIGDEVQMNVSGGNGPYEYSTDNPSVAVITDSDRVRAVGPGSTRVRVTDADGEESVTSGFFDVRAIKMDLEEVSVWPEDTFLIPVKIQVASGTTVYSGRFDLFFGSTIEGFQGEIVPGDFPVTMENNAKNGLVSVSFASTAGISGNGILCYLTFRSKTSGSSSIRFQDMRFNENLLAQTVKSTYYITVKSLPTLSISPNSATMMWGDVLKLNVYNGTAPYTWSVSDPAIASVDQQGNLTAITGGEVQVTARDDNGAVMTSGTFIVLDNEVSVFPAEGVLDTETKVPLITSSLPAGKAIYGFKANFSYNDTYLEFVRAEPVSGGGLIQASPSGNSVELAGALGQGVNSGIIGFLVFKIKSSLALNASTNISLLSFSANENSLHSVLHDGSIQRVEQASYRPVAIAGMDLSVTEGTSADLDGTASFDLDGDPLTYHWQSPENIMLSDTTSATPGFIAPYVDEDTEFIFTLIVNDGQDDSDPDEVTVTVKQLNQAPVADAGADRSLAEGSSVSLDGSNSYDPDNDALSYRWTSLDGIVLFNSNSVDPSFILPQVMDNTSYRFTLRVNDGAINSVNDTVTITAIQVNKKPVAFAGGDFSVNENESWTLDGSLSYDADNDPITYKWTAPPQVTLSSTTVAKPDFTAPPVLRDSVLTFTLVVNDGYRDSDPDVVKATIVNLDELSSETYIDSAYMTGLDSFNIDTTNAEVILYIPYGTDVRSLSPSFTVSEGAVINPAGGTLFDYSMPVYYTVTAQDGTTSRMWKVRVYRPEKTVQRTLNAGWNWISLNVQPSRTDISFLFSDLTLSDRDYVKSTEYSSIYYNATGWFGNLSAFPQNRFVKFKKSVAEDLLVQGLEINPAITNIALMKGWNDVAYLLRSNAVIDDAIITTALPSGDIVLKSINGSSVYYPGTGWAGEIDSLRILEGYKINAGGPGKLVYREPSGTKKSAAENISGRRELLKKYNLRPEEFESSATLIAEVLTGEGTNPTGKESLLLAYHNNEVRGISAAEYIADLDKYLFILTYFSNEEDQDISFRMKLSDSDREYSTDLNLPFRTDQITGKAFNPYRVYVDGENLARGKDPQNRFSVFPNPATDMLRISSVQDIHEFRLVSLTGQIMIRKSNPGRNFNLSIKDLAPGIYSLEAESTHGIFIRKIIKTSY